MIFSPPSCEALRFGAAMVYHAASMMAATLRLLAPRVGSGGLPREKGEALVVQMLCVRVGSVVRNSGEFRDDPFFFCPVPVLRNMRKMQPLARLPRPACSPRRKSGKR